MVDCRRRRFPFAFAAALALACAGCATNDQAPAGTTSCETPAHAAPDGDCPLEPGQLEVQLHGTVQYGVGVTR